MARTAELVLKDIYEGKPYKIVAQDLIDKLGALPAASAGQTNTLLNLIEAHQYILANFFNEIGIAAQWNGKRERVNTAETELMTGSYDINIWNMLENRKTAVEQINELFGTSISVELNPEIFYDGSENASLGDEEEVEGVDAEEPIQDQEDVQEEKEEKEEEKKDGGED